MRDQTAISRILLGLTLTVLVFAACKREPKRSEYFEKVFKEKAGATFRGVDLGMPLNEIRKIEASSPKHDDQWGQVFEYGLGGKNKYFVEYLVRNPAAKTGVRLFPIFYWKKSQRLQICLRRSKCTCEIVMASRMGLWATCAGSTKKSTFWSRCGCLTTKKAFPSATARFNPSELNIQSCTGFIHFHIRKQHESLYQQWR